MSGAGAIATVDERATHAGMAILEGGGGAVDAAVAANAVLAVVAPHLCGLGGDLFALVHDGTTVRALNASGRAGSGAGRAADALRAEGHETMPFRSDVRTVTVPGCVDGWIALHEAYGRLPLAEVLAGAIELASAGTPSSASLAAAVSALDPPGAAALGELSTQATEPGAEVRRPGVAAVLHDVAHHGRAGLYDGTFGHGLRAMAPELFDAEDLAVPGAHWVEPLAADAWRHRLWTVPPNSQGYITIGAAAIAAAAPLPDDPAHPQWAHVLIEASILAAYDRPAVLHDAADGDALLARVRRRAAQLDVTRASGLRRATTDADTTYLCAVDGNGVGISLIQSNGGGFGSWLVEPVTGINLHNRGVGFSLDPSHPAALRPGRRPPHTLAPVIVTDPSGRLVATVGSAGGDAQPQIVLQLLARLLHQGAAPSDAVAAPRWVLRSGPTGFDTWTSAGDDTAVVVEASAPAPWFSGLRALGHRVRSAPAGDGAFGHASAIVRGPGGSVSAAAEPRAR